MNKRKSKTTAQKYINFVEALAIYLLVAYFPLPSSILTIETAVLTASGRVALGVLFACLFLWITEPVPFHITGFLGVLLMLLLKVDSFTTLIKQGHGQRCKNGCNGQIRNPHGDNRTGDQETKQNFCRLITSKRENKQ